MREIDILIVGLAFLLGSFFGYAIGTPPYDPPTYSQQIEDVLPPMGQP